MDRQRAQSLIEQHEGRRKAAYLDSEGVLTVGIGLNLENKTARGRIEAIGVKYDELCAMQCSLTDAQIDQLFSDDLDTALTDAASRVPDFWSHPDDVQLAMVDMIFNLGGPRFSNFKQLIAALKVNDYLTAAAQMLDSKWAREDVPHRAADDIALVRGCAT
jgi:lysozyme